MANTPRKPVRKGKSKKTSRNQSKKRNLLPNWLKIFVIGFSCGLALQFIPGAEAITQETTDFFSRCESRSCVPLQATELPWANPILKRAGYTVAYDGRAKTALWVYEELTKESIRGNADRAHCKFTQDPDIPKIIQPNLSDYRGSGFDRGHLARAGNYRSSQSAMCETFYLFIVDQGLTEDT